MTKKGILMVISGPSGSGKGELVKRVLARRDDFKLSISATTRGIRDGEIHGVHYHFITREEFERRIANEEILEYNEYQGNLYGTPKREVVETLEKGENIILEIDINGALNVKRIFPEAVLVFIAPPDFETLEKRLRGRGDKVDESVIRGRLDTARSELAVLPSYEYLVINEDGEQDSAADAIISIAAAEQRRVSMFEGFAEQFYHRHR